MFALERATFSYMHATKQRLKQAFDQRTTARAVEVCDRLTSRTEDKHYSAATAR